MKRIVLIGGGENGGEFSTQIEKQIVSMLGVENPVVLYLPFSSEEDLGVYTKFKSLYEEQLGCKTLLCDGPEQSWEVVREQFALADLIYIGRGSTLRLAQFCKTNHYDQLIQEAYEQGKLIVGFSAGANFLCSASISSEEAGLIRVEGLGIFDVFCCTHFNYETRATAFWEHIRSDETGLALEDHSALVVYEDHCEALFANENAQAYVIAKTDGDQNPEAGPFTERMHSLKSSDRLYIRNLLQGNG